MFLLISTPFARLGKTAAVISFFLALTFPTTVGAVGVADVLHVPDNQAVSRGEFIRAAVRVLEIPVGDGTARLPYLRVARGLKPYVEAAHGRGALDVFTRDLQLARSITRGQALWIVSALKNLTGDDGSVDFNDVKGGTPEEQAVSVAIKQGWMAPLRENYFGVRRVLSGKDAFLLLRKVLGEDAPRHTVPEKLRRARKTPTITLTITGIGTAGRGSLPKSAILETIWKYINDHFVYEERIDPNEAAYRAAEAIVQSLGDPYSTFLRPAGARNLETQIKGKVSGIGAQVEQRNGILTIVSPLRSSPAEAAGLKPNDEILKADGVDLTGLPFMEAVERVRGPKGTAVLLTIRREGVEFEVSVVRDEVTVPEIEIKWQGEIAIVHLMQFGRLTENKLREEMEKVQQKRPWGIVLDLRSNPGGLLHAANIVVSNFVPKGTTVARIVSREGTRTDQTTLSPTIRSDVPMVVIVNEGSASASEIVAGALQDHGRVTVVGTKTFGKGTVQQVIRFNDESGLKVTIAEWQTPNGRKIDETGIKPDVIVEHDSERDEQLLKALEILR